MRAFGLILGMSVLLACNFHYANGLSEEEILLQVEQSLDNILVSLKNIEYQANPTTAATFTTTSPETTTTIQTAASTTPEDTSTTPEDTPTTPEDTPTTPEDTPTTYTHPDISETTYTTDITSTTDTTDITNISETTDTSDITDFTNTTDITNSSDITNTTSEPTNSSFEEYSLNYLYQDNDDTNQIWIIKKDAAFGIKRREIKLHKRATTCDQCTQIDDALEEVDRITGEIAVGNIYDKQVEDMETQEETVSYIEKHPSEDLLVYVEENDDEFSQKIEDVEISKDIVTEVIEKEQGKNTAIIVVSVVGSLFFLTIVALTVALVMQTKKTKKLKQPKPQMNGENSSLKDGRAPEIGSMNKAYVDDSENKYPPMTTKAGSSQNSQGRTNPAQRPTNEGIPVMRTATQKQVDNKRQYGNSYGDDLERMKRSSQMPPPPSAYSRDGRNYPTTPRPIPRANSRTREHLEMRSYDNMGRKPRSPYDPPKPFNYTSPPPQKRSTPQYEMRSQPGPSRSRNDLRRPYGPEDLY